MARQQERAKRTRAAIINSAAIEFGRSGYAAASLNRILEGSGATKGALYFHFDSKEDLAKAVLDAALEHQVAVTEPLFADEEISPLTAIARYTDQIADALVDEVVVQAGFRLTQDPEFFQDVVSASKDWFATFPVVARRAVEAGELRPDVDPEHFCSLLLATLVGQFFVSGLLEGPDLKTRFRDVFAVLVAAMATPGWKPSA